MRFKKTSAILMSFVILLTFVTPAFAAFSDVPANHPYKDAIEFCRAKDFVAGTSSTTFSPDAKLTRGQMALIWCKSLNIVADNHSYTDITKLKDYYDSSAIILRGLGILAGTSTKTFSPNGNLTREQLAVITKNTYMLGSDDPNAYKKYTDFASVSSYAVDGINSCLNAGVFEGLYDESTFKPQQPVTRGELCQLIYNISVPQYTITIADLEGGTITATPDSARPGTVITLTITPDQGKQLKADTLKFNGTAITGNTFVMPAADVTITAEFEDKPVALESIAVTAPPTKATYTVGETLDLTGMVVTATYSDDSSKAVTGFSTTPEGGSTLSTEGPVTITVSYTEGGVTKTATTSVQVNPATPAT